MIDDVGVNRIWEAIWTSAFHDEMREQKRRLFYDLTTEAFPDLKTEPGDRRWNYRVHIRVATFHLLDSWVRRNCPTRREDVRRIESIFDRAATAMQGIVSRKIVREAERWPSNRIGYIDEEYEQEYKSNLVKLYDAIKR